jgi:hypothetical protein
MLDPENLTLKAKTRCIAVNEVPDGRLTEEDSAFTAQTQTHRTHDA